MAKKVSPEAIESVTKRFPDGTQNDPTIKTMIETIASMTKKSLALACAELLPAAYPSQRKAERETEIETLRGDFATLIAGVCLGHKTERESTDPNAAAVLGGARAWAREIEIQRIEAKAKEAGERMAKRVDDANGGAMVRTLDGRELKQSEALAEIANSAHAMIADHEATHGRPASVHEQRTAVRVAKSEIFGMRPHEAATVAKAEEKRARKAARLARELPRAHEREAVVG